MVEQHWSTEYLGVVELPSGRLLRGRRLRGDPPPGPTPTLAVHLTGRRPPEPPWKREWVRWRDFWLPSNPDAAIRVLRLAHERARSARVEIACGGGVGRTGTALALMCVFEGMEADAAVDWVRERYHPRAVEVPWQRRFLRTVRTAGPHTTR
ncbi:MAG: protein-tyrosine phosphatase family protein [Actinomycetota bacterium]|nr:protein-tyrosine phosphatase family protein [Actinomycetota bacterium]